MTKQSISEILWNREDKQRIAEAAKVIYANGFLDGVQPSKLQAFREAVTTEMPPEKQKPIPSLAHIRYWAQEWWPSNTEPLDVIARLRAEREAEAVKRVKMDFTEPEQTASPAVEAPAPEPTTATPVVAEAQSDFWTKPEKPLVASTDPLFDEAALAQRNAEHVAEAAAAVPVTRKKSRTPSAELMESPEALITRGLTELLAERINTVVDRRTSAIFEAKTKTFVEEALSAQLTKFHDDMSLLVMALEESMTKAVSTMQSHVDDAITRIGLVAPLDDRASSSKSSEPAVPVATSVPENEPVEYVPSMPREPVVKPNILVLGAADGTVQHIKQRYGRMVNLEIYTGPNNDKRNPAILMDQPNLDGILVSNKFSSLTIIDALQKRKHLSPIIHNVSGSLSSMAPVIDKVIHRKQREVNS